MAKEIKYNVDLFKSISEDLAHFNGGKQKEFTQISNSVILNFTEWAKAVNPKITVNQIAVAKEVYLYLFCKKQNSTGWSLDDYKQKGRFVGFDQCAYPSMETIAKHIGVGEVVTKTGRVKVKTDNVKQAVTLLADMNLLIVKQYKTDHVKYAFFVLKEPNSLLCNKYGSDFKTQKKGLKKDMTIKEVVKKVSKHKGKKSNFKVTYIEDYKKAN